MAFVEPTAPKYRVRRQSSITKNLTRFTGEKMVYNIATVFDQATEEEFGAGMGWYHVAHELAKELGIGVREGAGVMAALSPQLSWGANIAAAQNLVENDNPLPAGIGTFVERARFIRDGADPNVVLGGRKVRSFFRNIYNPDVAGPVTIDRHAMAIATNVDVSALNSVGSYQMIAGAYRTAARIIDLKPHELQAICWVAHRRMLNEQGARGAHFRT